MEHSEELVEKTKGISLSTSFMSVRLFNCLKRAGYSYLSEVLLLNADDYKDIRNFGRQCEEELYRIKAFAINSDREQIERFCFDGSAYLIERVNKNIISIAKGQKVDDDSFYVINSMKERVEDELIDPNQLSTRAYNGLNRANIKSVRQLATLDMSILMNVGGLGEKAYQEIVEFIDAKTEVDKNASLKNTDCWREIERTAESLIELFERYIEIDDKDAFRSRLENCLCSHFIENGVLKAINISVLSEIVKMDPVNLLIRKRIHELAGKDCFDRVKLEDVSRDFSWLGKIDGKVFDITLETMINNKEIRTNQGYLFEYKQLLEEWIDSLSDNSAVVIKKRVEGETLEEIGRLLGVTRERVRQIITKELRRKPSLFEDGYSVIFSDYGFSDAEFSALFQVNMETINYLKLKYKKGTKDIQNFMEDDTIPDNCKRNAAEAFKGSFLLIDDEIIPVRRDVLLAWVLKKYFSETECSLPELEDFYYEFLDNNELITFEKLKYPTVHAFEARVADYANCYMKYGRKVRFSNIEAIDICELLEKINIRQYKNMELSTLKIFIDNQEYLEQMDVQDEYELHNLLRKKQANITDYDIEIGRMPFITIGNGNRERQVRELLYQLAPISNDELAREYEIRYGVKKETVLANFFKEIDIYLHDGIFDVEQTELDDNEYRTLKESLTDDFYMWDEIVDTYNSISEHNNFDAINAMTLKKMGYKVFSQYVIKNVYPSADAYFSQVLLEKSRIDLELLKPGMRSLQSFYSCLYGYRDSLDLIEIEKNKFIKFDAFVNEVASCTKEELKVIGKRIVDSSDDEVFAIRANTIDDAINPFYSLVNTVYFFYSLVRIQPGIKASIFGEVCIIAKNGKEASLLGLLKMLLKKNGPSSFEDLVNQLWLQYGVDTDRYKVAYFLKQADDVMVDEIAGDAYLKKEDDEPTRAFWDTTAYGAIIEQNKGQINNSNATIAGYYWKEKYKAFVKACDRGNITYMRDLVTVDVEQICISAGIIRPVISEIIHNFVDWVKGLSVEGDSEDIDNIMDLFFK